MLKAELHKIQGESDIQNVQQNVIDDLIAQMTQVQSPYSVLSGKRQKPLFPADPALTEHLRSAEMSQQSRQAPATSSNNPESPHEPNGPVGRLRNDHEVPTETRKDPLWWESRTTGFITTQLSNMGWRKHHFEHFTQKGEPVKRLTKTHDLKELFLLGELDF